MYRSSENSLLAEGETLRGRWIINNRIGCGGFGQIYEAFDRTTRQPVAIKVEARNALKPVLRMEVNVLRRLHGSPYACTYEGCGRTDHINYLVMQIQGRNLSDLRRSQSHQKFSVSTSLRLVYEALYCIEAVHGEGFLHRDIKPSNFAIGATKETSTKVFILDFGLARHIINSEGKLRAPRSFVGFRGTVRYASLNAHREKELGRHDDLISLFYMTVEFIFGKLPWKRIKNKNCVAASKKEYTANELLKGKFPELESIYSYLEQLDYFTKPNYEYIRRVLCRCILNNRVRFDDTFDWEKEASCSSSLLKSTDGGFEEILVPKIEVPGRLFPVEIIYESSAPDKDNSFKCSRKKSKIDPGLYLKVLSLIEQSVPKNERGDVLIFLSGAQEISCIQEELDGREGWIILPLHSALPINQQDRVFLAAPAGLRKCILSTNISETSVTIDGVRFVVDSGKVKEMTYDASCRAQKLKEFWCSKASAEQRKGRAGRTGPGKCFRLYSVEQFENMNDYSEPEMRRVPLHSLVLQLVQLGLSNVRNFPFLEKPNMDSLEHSICTLVRQGALTADETLTAMGRILAKLPVDISIGKVLLLGCMFRELLEACLTLAAALSIPSALSQQSFREYETLRKRKDLEDDRGDAFMIVRIYHKWLQLKLDGSESSHRWCRKRGIEEQRLYELSKLRSQFLRILKEAKFYDSPETAMSSTERAKRNGEILLLKDLRKVAATNEKKSQKRKLDVRPIAHNEDDDECLDLKDIDFKLAQDEKTLHRLLRRSSELNPMEKATLLWILTASLYPQVALSDMHNSYKKDSDQLFHTHAKGFVTLHPNSVLALNPEVFRLNDLDVLSMEGGLRISTRHQTLAYMSLLETTKAYLVNCVRFPTLQYILLLAGEIHTSPCLKIMTFDSIVGVQIYESPESRRVHILLLRVLLARLLFQKVFQSMLEETSLEAVDRKQGISSETRRLSRVLLRHIGEVLMNFDDISYTQKRLLPADLKVNFCKESLKLCGFLYHGSLESPSESKSSKLEANTVSFSCPICDAIHGTFASCAVHLEYCILNTSESQKARPEALEQAKDGYFCEKCQKYLDSFDKFLILKHNRECETQKSEVSK